jgi:predicted PurR-regulated permease PerM
VRQIALFWIWGLLAVALGYFLYTSMSYVFLLLAALIISLAMEGVVSFRWRLTHNRGVGIAIAYLLLLLFLFSGFIIMVPFFLSRGTQILQSIMTSVQGIQTAILTQGIEGYIRTSSRIPTFFHDDILAYIQTSSSLSLIQTISDNLGQVVNLTSTYLKTIGEYTVNIFGGIFSIAGKMIILFTLSIFFSLSHYEVKYGLKYLLRRVVTSREKIDAVYEGIASRLKSQLLLCVFIGLTTYL